MNYLGFESSRVKEVSQALNQLLADYQIYYQNLRSFHWNVAGEHFFDLHAQFEELYNKAKINIDEIAERVLTLRQTPMSQLSNYLEHSNIKESAVTDPLEMVTQVLDNHKTLIAAMRIVIDKANNAGDEGTIDMTAGFLAAIEKDSWMLDAWSQRQHAEVANSQFLN